jgi:hypothetical protein
VNLSFNVGVYSQAQGAVMSTAAANGIGATVPAALRPLLTDGWTVIVNGP